MRRTRTPVLEALEGRAPLAAPTPGLAYAAAASAPGLVTNLTTDHSVYHKGQPVLMTLTETNTSPHDITIVVGPSIDGFVVSQNGKAVWASNTGLQPMFLGLETLKPGKSITLQATWDGRSNIGPASIPTGALVVRNQLAPTASVVIDILPS